MKFDYVIGNPPFGQESIQKENINNKQKPQKNIFQFFQTGVDKLTNTASVLIYPGGRWIHRSGKGLKQFGLEQINDPTLKKIVFYPHSRDVFPSIDIDDGISIVLKEKNKESNGFDYIYISDGKSKELHVNNPGTELMLLNPDDITINQKISKFVNDYCLQFLHESILPRSLFGIESDFIELNPDKAVMIEQETQCPDGKVKIFTNDKAGSAGRAKWFLVDRSLIKKSHELIDEWQVVVSSAHPGGQKGRDKQLSIIDNHSVFGRSRLALGSFKTEEEANNFYNYISSKVITYTFLLSEEKLTSLGKKVPNITDYSKNNQIIDFSQDIDKQLIKLLGLTKEEFEYIENQVEKASIKYNKKSNTKEKH